MTKRITVVTSDSNKCSCNSFATEIDNSGVNHEYVNNSIDKFEKYAVKLTLFMPSKNENRFSSSPA